MDSTANVKIQSAQRHERAAAEIYTFFNEYIFGASAHFGKPFFALGHTWACKSPQKLAVC
jgi:hypothetical protein